MEEWWCHLVVSCCICGDCRLVVPRPCVWICARVGGLVEWWGDIAATYIHVLWCCSVAGSWQLAAHVAEY
jgi:hypothetical protein